MDLDLVEFKKNLIFIILICLFTIQVYFIVINVLPNFVSIYKIFKKNIDTCL